MTAVQVWARMHFDDDRAKGRLGPTPWAFRAGVFADRSAWVPPEHRAAVVAEYRKLVGQARAISQAAEDERLVQIDDDWDRMGEP